MIKQSINHDQYNNALTASRCTFIVQRQIRSKSHQLHSIEVNRMRLHPFDDKQFILSDCISTLSHGHYRISDDINVNLFCCFTLVMEFNLIDEIEM